MEVTEKQILKVSYYSLVFPQGYLYQITVMLTHFNHQELHLILFISPCISTCWVKFTISNYFFMNTPKYQHFECLITFSALLVRQDKSTWFKQTLTKHTTHTNLFQQIWLQMIFFLNQITSNDHFKIKYSPQKVMVQCYKSLKSKCVKGGNSYMSWVCALKAITLT